MRIRLGYVAMALGLQDGSPNKTLTYKRYTELKDDEIRLYKLKDLTKQNLEISRRILLYNKASDIHLYRFTSKLIPLATHAEVFNWDYTALFKEEFEELGRLIKDIGIRVSAHPDHFTVINTPKTEILKSAVVDLDYHVRLFEAMNLDEKEAKLVVHVGGTYGSKEKAAERFIENFRNIDPRLSKRIILENDDKSFTAKEVLSICKKLSIPMVLDIHHHWCNNDGEKLEDLWEDIYNTWNREAFPPKIHVSSPKDNKNIRAHSDYVDIKFLMGFLRIAKALDRDFDIMIEAKMKDNALLKAMEELKAMGKVSIIDGGTIEY